MTITAYLYTASGHDKSVTLDKALVNGLKNDQLLWIDVSVCDDAAVAAIGATLGIKRPPIERLCDKGADRHLDNHGGFFAFTLPVFAADSERQNTEPATLGFLVGPRWLVTIHDTPVKFLSAFMAQDKGETAIGTLSPSLLVASLLDWHLGEYFRQVAHIEAEVDELDDAILDSGTEREVLGKIVAIRRRVSTLRALIANQRPIFHGLTRPDFALNTDEAAANQFQLLSGRFDRAVDEIERTRDVVVGSFDLFTSISSQQTNDLVKVLTFVTVLLGACAAVAGLLGMNFNAPFFNSGGTGFIVAAGAMTAFAVLMTVVAKLKKWI